MFTGIIRSIGEITTVKQAYTDGTHGCEITVRNQLALQLGDSVAVNGVCLTVAAIHQDYFTAQVSPSTLAVSTGLDTLQAVNLEPALCMGDTLGGHWVSGHVDGVGEVISIDQHTDYRMLGVRLPASVAGFMAIKGSVCLQGVSLTINTLQDESSHGCIIGVTVVPYTLLHTTLSALKIGDKLNVEVDMLARYIARIVTKSESQRSNT